MELNCHYWPSLSVSESRFLFLHGMGGTGALWRPVALGLENEASILAPDQRGHGGSRDSQLTQFHPLDYATDVLETLRERAFSPAWVVGHSMGVRTACAFANLKADWVQGLVLVDLGFSGLAGGSLGPRLAQFLKTLPESFPSRESARQYMAEHCPDASIAQYLIAVSVKDPDQPTIRFPFDADALQKTITASQHVSLEPWIREFAASGKPVLVLRGANSRVYSSETFEAEKAKMADTSVAFEEWPGCGHGLPFEKRLEFVERIKRFSNEKR